MNRSRLPAIIFLCLARVSLAGDPTPPIPPQHIKIDSSILDVDFNGSRPDLPASAILQWINHAANAVAGYYGKFPVPHVRLKVELVDGRNGVFDGTTWGHKDGALTRISLGQHTTQARLDQDWMLTHEMVHMAFPSVPRQSHWIEEGIATYVEPIARAQTGQLAVETIWGDMLRSMPQGEPESVDRGLDHTHTWGRTYWGGALFCLLAEVQIRERTHNRKGLQDAFRGILQAGGNIENDWSMARALSSGDAATGVPVLMELYGQMKATPVKVDLPALWKRLGVELRGRTVVFDDQAPLAGMRKAITANANDERAQ